MPVETFGDEDLGTLRDGLSKSKFFKLKDGDNKIRIVRWKNKEGKSRTACKRVEHFVPGAGAPIVCKGKGCEICDKVARLASSGDDATKETARRMRATDRIYFNVIDRSNETAGVQSVAFPPGLSKAILDLINDDDYNTNENGEIVKGLMLDIEKGRDIKIRRFKEENQVKYTPTPAPNPSKVTVGETIDLETYLSQDASAKKSGGKKEEPVKATAVPSCHGDGETYTKDSEMCQQCDHVATCEKGI